MSLFRVRRSIVSTLLALVALPLTSASLAAQTGTINGRVTNAASGQPIENAQIQAQMTGGQSYGAISGSDGQFRVLNLPDGSYTITVRAIGFDQRAFPNQRPGTTLAVALTERATQLNQTVVTASRSRPEKQLDAPAQISVISSERIAERPAVTVTDHLRSTPGIDINKGGIAQANIVARGFNNAFSGAMLMLQDYRFAGVPSLRVNVPFLFTGTMEDIDRMEVLLGPASALYGPNSSNGVLHVITKSPFNSAGSTINLDYGERAIVRGGLRHAGVINEKLAYKLSGEYMQGNDWEYNDLSETRTFPTTTNVPESRRGQSNQRDFELSRFSGEARLDVRPTPSSEAITTLGYTKLGSGLELTGANGTAQIKNWTYTSLQQRFRVGRLFAQAFINLSDAGNDTSTSDKGTFLLQSGQPIVDQSRVAAAQLQHGFDLGARQSFTYGADYIWTNPRTGHTINGANEDVDNVTEYGAYIQSSTKPIRQVELLLAARGDANNVIEGAFFSPRVALILKPTETQNVRFTYNRAFSTPANFSFFLDLIQRPNAGGSGFDIRARGNPPKEGFQFNRSCGTGAAGGLCMKSRFTGSGEFVAANAASAFGPLVGGNAAALTPSVTAGIQGALQQAGFTAAQAGALAPGLATGLVQYLAGRQPTSAELATRLSYLGTSTSLDPSRITDIAPLKASFNNTYEVGYKGIVGGRFRFDVSYWGQERGDVGTSAAIVTPNVFFGDTTQLQGYIRTQSATFLTGALQQAAGLPAANAAALANGIGAALGGSVGRSFAPAPLGVVTFNGVPAPANQVYATYFNVNKKIWIRGLDIATDVVATDRLTFDVSYSWQSRNVFGDVNGGNGAPLMSNSPNSRGSLGGRYRNELSGLGFEVRTRYNESYPVNSGVYATNVAFPIAPGQLGALATPATGGYNRCNPAPAGTFCYENVPEAFIFDAQVSKRFDIGAQRLTWTINATNLFDNRIRTFPGVPEIGRLIMTRVQYTF
jgi:outer membrane receptor for ferrienterochelin and colicins